MWKLLWNERNHNIKLCSIDYEKWIINVKTWSHSLDCGLMVTRISLSYPFLSNMSYYSFMPFLYGFSSILQEFQCICSVLNADVSGLNSAASAVPRYTLAGVLDLSDQILRLIFYLNNHCQASGFCTQIPFSFLFSLSRSLFFSFFFLVVHCDWCLYPCLVISGFPVCQLKMQEVLPQPLEAFEAYLDSYVQKAT